MSALGSPAASFVAADALPPVARMRPDKARPRRKSASGTSSIYGILGSQDTNTATKGELWYGSFGDDGISAKMRRDPHIEQSIGYVTNPLVSARWRFRPASQSPLDVEVADWCSYCFFERLPWAMILERMVAGYTADGFSLAEMTDDTRPIPVERFRAHPGRQRGVGVVPTGLHDIPQNTVSKWHKKPGEPTRLASIEQWQPFDDKESPGYRSVPADRIVRFTTGQRGSSFAGVPILRSAYGPWKIKNALQTFEAIGFERTAVGVPVATPGEAEDFDKEEAESVELLLENMRVMAKGAIVLPPGYKLEWSGAGENDVSNLNIAIERCNTDMAANVSAGFTRLGLTGPGSYALGTTQAGQYHLSTVRHANLVETVFNLGLDGWSPIRRIVDLNYGADVQAPVLEARNLPTRDIKTSLSLLFNGVSQGVITPDDPLEEEARDMLDVGPRDPGSARKKPAPVVAVPPGDDAEQDDVEAEGEEEENE